MNPQQKVNKPIFVIGTNRVGKELFMNLVAYHSEFAWLSNYNMRFPQNQNVSIMNRILDFPFMNSKLKYKKGVPKLSSAYMFWNNRFKGFRRPFRDLVADDVSHGVAKDIYQSVHKILQLQHKKRFIAQYSGWSRIGFFKKIFPDAKFIHLVRDGRAVANSLTNYEGWEGWEGYYNWRLGYIPDNNVSELLKQNNNSFLAIAALEWKVIVNNVDEMGLSLNKNDFMTVKYEDLIKSPKSIIKECFEFFEIDNRSNKYEKHFNTIKIYNANEQTVRIPSWRKNLSKDQINMLERFLEIELKKFNYTD
jgi:omega-hydroxy-beta-dihydromenaquinone-9 sulfotransferase